MATNVTSRARVSPLPDVAGLGGALAGLGGGLAMAVAAALISLAQGGDIWLESRQIASLVYGGSVVTESGFAAGPVVVGTLLHFVFSALFGAIFGILMRRVLKLPTDFGLPLLCGLIYGFMIWMAAYFVVLPALNSPLLNSYAPSFIIQHLIYGMVTGLLYTKLSPTPYDARLTAEE
ncbi:MAG TPA: hypothetical protein VFS21_06025 [Roseiflexaceae bacterium]|nr:hypothetical protein [Roseiflexaceae bacterium]